MGNAGQMVFPGGKALNVPPRGAGGKAPRARLPHRSGAGIDRSVVKQALSGPLQSFLATR